MGQYFVLVDVTKGEWVNPHFTNDGYKEWEICANGSMARLGMFLMACGDDDGGAIRGRWAGDHVVLAGDYDPDEKYQVPKYISAPSGHGTYSKTETEASNLYHYAKLKFVDVSLEAIEAFNKYMGSSELEINVPEYMADEVPKNYKHLIEKRRAPKAISPDLIISGEGVVGNRKGKAK